MNVVFVSANAGVHDYHRNHCGSMAMKQYVFVDILTVASNRERNQVSPPIVVTGGGQNEPPRAGCRVRINGPCEIIYNKNGVVHLGQQPHIAVVTEADVEVITEYLL